MICREACQQSSGATVFGTGVSQSCPVSAAQRCRRGSRCSATSERAPQNHGSQFPTGLSLAQPHLATTKALCSLLPLSQLETTLQANRTDISNPWPTPVLPTGPGPAGLQPPTSHGAVHPQLRDTAAPPAPALPHRPGGTQPPSREGARAPCHPAQDRTPSPMAGEQQPRAVPARRKELRPAHPLSVPAAPAQGTVLLGARHWPHSPACGSGQHSHCQAQPSPPPGHAAPVLGKLGRWDSRAARALRDTGAPLVLLGHNRLVLVPIPVCSLLLLGWTQTHRQPTLPAGPA